MAGSIIANAPSGNKAALVGTEKFPIDGSQYALISAIAEYNRTLTQILTGKTISLTDNTLTGTSAELRAAISDETGAGVAVFNDTPTIITPTIASFANATHNHTSNATGGAIVRVYPIELNSGAISPADATTYHFGAPLAVGTSTNADSVRQDVMRTGTITRIWINFRPGTGGTTEQSTVSLRLNDTTDTVITTTLDLSTFAYATANVSIAVTAGDRIVIKWATPTWVTNPTNVQAYAHVQVEYTS